MSVVRFATTDFFIVGIGFDLVGAWLVARGLIAKPQAIVLRHATYFGASAPAVVAAAEDRIDGRFGVVSLLLGFGLQALGYILQLADDGPSSASTDRAATAVALLAVAVVVALATWRLLRIRLLKSLLIEMAHWEVIAGDKPAERRDRPNVASLAAWGTNIGEAPRDGENDATYVARIFGVADRDAEAGEGPPQPT